MKGVAEGSRLLTSRGYFPIESLVDSESVEYWDGMSYKTGRVEKSSAESELVELTLVSGETVQLSSRQGFFKAVGEGVVNTLVTDLVEGDVLSPTYLFPTIDGDELLHPTKDLPTPREDLFLHEKIRWVSRSLRTDNDALFFKTSNDGLLQYRATFTSLSTRVSVRLLEFFHTLGIAATIDEDKGYLTDWGLRLTLDHRAIQHLVSLGLNVDITPSKDDMYVERVVRSVTAVEQPGHTYRVVGEGDVLYVVNGVLITQSA